MEGKKKKKDTGDESPGYEDLLDGFAFEQRTDENRTDFDGLALAELLGDEGGPGEPEERKDDGADTGVVEDYSDLARQFENLDLNTLDTVAAEEPAGQFESASSDEPESEESVSFDGSLELKEEELGDGSEYASLLDSIGAENNKPQAAEPEEFSLEDLHLDEVPDTVDTKAEPEGEPALADFDFAGFSLDDFKSPEESAPVKEDQPPVPEGVEIEGLNLEEIPEEALDIEGLKLEEAPEEATGFEDFKWNAMTGEVPSAAEETAEHTAVADVTGEIALTADETISIEEEALDGPVETAGVGYAAALGDMFGDDQAAASEEEPVIFDNGTGDESSAEALFDTEQGEEELSISNLLGGSGEEETGENQTAELKAVEEPAVEPEHDFLGLSSLGAAPAEKKEEKKKARTKTEALYEGVAMDFDEQIAEVTRAELLLAQGKKKEAADLFMDLSKKKGVTSWVAKRVRALTSAQDR